MHHGLRLDSQPDTGRQSAASGSGKALSLVISAFLHVAVIAAMLWLPGVGPSGRQPTLYEQEIEPHKDKIIWYRLQTLPKITPEIQANAIRHPGAARPNKDTIVSHLPDAPNTTQLSWTETPKPQPRAFQAPDMISVRKQPKLMDNAPQLAPEAAGELKSAQMELPKLAPKPFVAPGKQTREPEPVRQVSLSDAPTLARMPIPSGYDSSLAALAAASGVKTPKPFTAPPAKKPGARPGNGTVADLSDAPGIVTGGSGDVNALVLNTLHSAISGDLPPPSNSNVSVGPRSGSDAGGPGSGLRLPGVTVQPGGRSPLPDASGQGAALVPPPLIATSVAPLRQTFSAPLAPSSRSIPAAIESRFHNRVVYSMVLPMKRVPGYSADWIMWFAEHQPENGAGSLEQIRAPLPMRKVYRLKSGVALPRSIQLAATIDRTGKAEDIRAISSAAGPAAEAAMEDFGMWEFLPALRNRVPVDVDVIVEVTFSALAVSPVIHPGGSAAGN